MSPRETGEIGIRSVDGINVNILAGILYYRFTSFWHYVKPGKVYKDLSELLLTITHESPVISRKFILKKKKERVIPTNKGNSTTRRDQIGKGPRKQVLKTEGTRTIEPGKAKFWGRNIKYLMSCKWQSWEVRGHILKQIWCWSQQYPEQKELFHQWGCTTIVNSGYTYKHLRIV